jgi:hypothetical protein
MSEPVNSHSGRSADGSPVLASGYEPPRLIAMGNLHDLLAGTGSQPCDNGALMTGPDPVQGPAGPGECGPAG